MDDVRIEAAAKALAQLEPDEPWPTNKMLGGGPAEARDDDFRQGHIILADEMLTAADAVDPLRNPRVIETVEELDALPNELLILTEQGGYWESIKRVDGLNWWKEPGAQVVVSSEDLTLPAIPLPAPEFP